jgi:hypothetical protein
LDYENNQEVGCYILNAGTTDRSDFSDISQKKLARCKSKPP